MSSLLRLERQQKTFLKLRVEFTYFSFFLIYKMTITFVHFLSFSRKPYPIPDRSGESLYPFSNRNGAKTIPLRHLPYWLIQGIPSGVLNYLRTVLLFWSASITFCSTAWTGSLNVQPLDSSFCAIFL